MTREEAANELQSYADSSWGGLNKAFELAIAALREQEEYEIQRHRKHFDIKAPRPATDTNVGHKWISVEESLPDEWVSVLGYMTDAGEFPAVRECYRIYKDFYFTALREFHPVSHWMPMPTKEEV